MAHNKHTMSEEVVFIHKSPYWNIIVFKMHMFLSCLVFFSSGFCLICFIFFFVRKAPNAQNMVISLSREKTYWFSPLLSECNEWRFSSYSQTSHCSFNNLFFQLGIYPFLFLHFTLLKIIFCFSHTDLYSMNFRSHPLYLQRPFKTTFIANTLVYS